MRTSAALCLSISIALVAPSRAESPPREATAPAPSSGMRAIIIQAHARQNPDVQISDRQEALLVRADAALAEADPKKNPIATVATVVPAEMVESKITETGIAMKMNQDKYKDRCAEGLARALGAESYLRVEVVSIEGPVSDAPPPPGRVEPAAKVEEPATAARDKKKAKDGNKEKSVQKPQSPTKSEPPRPAAGEEKWTVHYRLTLLAADGAAPATEDLTLQGAPFGVVRTRLRTAAVTLLERLNTNRRAAASGGNEKQGLLLYTGVAAAAIGLGLAGYGAYWIAKDGQASTPVTAPARHTPEVYDSMTGGAVMVAVGAALVVGGAVSAIYSLRHGTAPPVCASVTPYANGGGGVAAGVAVGGNF